MDSFGALWVISWALRHPPLAASGPGPQQYQFFRYADGIAPAVLDGGIAEVLRTIAARR